MSAPLTWWQRAVMIVGALALIALGLHDVLLLFRRTREKGFIIQHSEYGDMSISMNAAGKHVQKCVASHQELTVNATHIQHAREGIVVDTKRAISEWGQHSPDGQCAAKADQAIHHLLQRRGRAQGARDGGDRRARGFRYGRAACGGRTHSHSGSAPGGGH